MNGNMVRLLHRSNRANLARHASFYFALQCSYAVALGLIALRLPLAITSVQILAAAQKDATEFKAFFGANAGKP
jgi:hypothetical protein